MIEAYIQRHETLLEQIIQDTSIPAPSLRSAMHYALFPGGKRIRPLLVYLVGAVLHTPLPVLDLIAIALELTHCYSLIHDDLPAMDNDDLRRGKPSCHKAYDEATAILVGDGMQALAIDVLLSRLPSLLQASQVITVTQILLQASGVSGMISGQSLDLSELAKPFLTQEQVREIHLLKTGKLILACIEMVLATQAVQAPLVHAFKTYAQHLGLVFQMQDDYLDHYAPSKLLGKNQASDRANQKTTFATLLPRKSLEEAIALHYQQALDPLLSLNIQASALIELTHQLQNRSKL